MDIPSVSYCYICFDVPLGKTESVNWNSLSGVFVSGAPGVWASTNKDPSLLQSCLFPVPCSLCSTVYLAEHCVWSGCRFLHLLSVCDFSVIIYTHIFSVRLWWDHFNIMLTMSVFFFEHVALSPQYEWAFLIHFSFSSPVAEVYLEAGFSFVFIWKTLRSIEVNVVFKFGHFTKKLASLVLVHFSQNLTGHIFKWSFPCQSSSSSSSSSLFQSSHLMG